MFNLKRSTERFDFPKNSQFYCERLALSECFGRTSHAISSSNASTLLLISAVNLSLVLVVDRLALHLNFFLVKTLALLHAELFGPVLSSLKLRGRIVWWSGSHVHLQDKKKTCFLCCDSDTAQLVREVPHKKTTASNRLPVVKKDTTGPHKEASPNNKYLFFVIDHISRWPGVFALPNATATKINEFFKDFLPRPP